MPIGLRAHLLRRQRAAHLRPLPRRRPPLLRLCRRNRPRLPAGPGAGLRPLDRRPALRRHPLPRRLHRARGRVRLLSGRHM